MENRDTTFDTNASGTIVRPSLHDGSFAGLILDEGKARILLADAEGQHFALHLRGVERLRAEDVREGNIVLDVVIRRCDQSEQGAIAYLLGIEPVDRDPEPVARWLSKAETEKMLIVELNPSHGCSLTALCRDVEIVEGGW